MEIIVVKSGDTIYSISREYGVPVTKLAIDNGIINTDALVTGQSLVILKPAVTHTVSAGETLSSIARTYGTTVIKILRNNYGLSANDILPIGFNLIIANQGEQVGRFEAGGYAYPFISRRLLHTVLPYLTYLMPFTYGFMPNGTLVMLNDEQLISSAFEFNVAPYMHLSTLTDMGVFSNELSHVLLNSPEIQDILLSNVLTTMRIKGYLGLDVDFEFVYSQDRDAYSAFILKARELMNQNGYQLIVALPPKTSDDQPGLLYEGVDYAAMGAAANSVLLMTYEWGYSFGPPLAVAPVPAVRRVIEYALTRIPKEKIFLGMPNYGYNWTLPYVRGGERAPSLSTVEAMQIALRYGAEIQYDEIAEAPFFFYTDEFGREHVVWFEDARSVSAKLNLVLEYGLRGVLYWDLMRENPQNYVTLNGLIDVIQL